MLNWYLADPPDYFTSESVTWTYVTTTTLTATFNHRRDFAQALPASAQAFSAASYVMIHSKSAANKRGPTYQWR
jgi:hypothetical protein